MFVRMLGVNTVIDYSPKIFMIVGFQGAHAAIWAAVSVGAVNVAFTFLSLVYVDKLGRRKLYFIGLSGIVVSLFALGLYLPSTTVWEIQENGWPLFLYGFILLFLPSALARLDG